MEALIRSMISAGPPEKRPPHMRLLSGNGAAAGVPVLLSWLMSDHGGG